MNTDTERDIYKELNRQARVIKAQREQIDGLRTRLEELGAILTAQTERLLLLPAGRGRHGRSQRRAVSA